MTIVTDISERKEHEREQEAILEVASALRTADTRADMIPIILKQVIEMIGPRSLRCIHLIQIRI